MKTEVYQLRENVEELNHALTMAEKELDLSKMEEIRLGKELNTLEDTCKRKERDFQAAIECRDTSLKELKKMTEKLNKISEKNKLSEIGWQDAIDTSNLERKELAEQLQQVVAAHSNLQRTVDKLQIELGKTDEKCTALSDENRDLRRNLFNMEKERIDWVVKSEEQATALTNFNKQVSSVKEDVQLLRNQFL